MELDNVFPRNLRRLQAFAQKGMQLGVSSTGGGRLHRNPSYSLISSLNGGAAMALCAGRSYEEKRDEGSLSLIAVDSKGPNGKVARLPLHSLSKILAGDPAKEGNPGICFRFGEFSSWKVGSNR